MNKKQQILSLLKQSKQSIHSLSTSLNSPPSSIRGRLSEIKRDGYILKKITIPTTYYTLDQTPQTLLTYLKENNLFDTYLSISTLSKKLNIPKPKLESAISTLFNTHSITQFSSDQFIIHETFKKV